MSASNRTFLREIGGLIAANVSGLAAWNAGTQTGQIFIENDPEESEASNAVILMTASDVGKQFLQIAAAGTAIVNIFIRGNSTFAPDAKAQDIYDYLDGTRTSCPINTTTYRFQVFRMLSRPVHTANTPAGRPVYLITMRVGYAEL